MILGMYPFLQGCPISWHIIVHSSLMTLCISVTSIIPSPLFNFIIWVFSLFLLVNLTTGGQVPAGRLVDRARWPSGGQVPAGRLVDRARWPSGGQVPAGRLDRKNSPHPYTEIWMLHEILLAKLLLTHSKVFLLIFPGYSNSEMKVLLILKNFPFPCKVTK